MLSGLASPSLKFLEKYHGTGSERAKTAHGKVANIRIRWEHPE